MALVFFDLDKTLLDRNSGVEWLKRAVRTRTIGPVQAFQALAWLAQYKMGLQKAESPLIAAIKTLRGQSEAAFSESMQAFFEAQIDGHYRPGALRALKAHQDAKEPCVILTSASGKLADLVAERLQFDGAIGSRFAVDAEGRFTGEAEGRIPFGDGKRVLAEAEAKARGFELKDAVFYTDSMSDLPAMLAMGHPVAVNPDPRLRREAESRGWPVEDWS